MYLPSTHTSPLIAQALNDIIISWRIDKKVMSITTDNGPNMVAAFKIAKTNDKYLHAIGDVPTRWSNYNRLNKILLEEDEWDFMLEMINILGPFYKSTLILGASNYVTISLMYPVVEALKEKFKVETNYDEYCDEPILESSETVFDE
ncbi:17335_t:CDS:2 [Entrophospora sp. SA101]|nr:17335_t:CDS:2 [Entrophospora sp. SA101]